MQAESIVVIVAVSSLLLFVIASVVRARTRGIVPSWIPFILMFVGVLFLILVIFRGQELQPYHWAEVLVLVGLLLVTAVYADSTAKMAEEMKEQRYTETLPLLLPEIPNIVNAKDPRDAYSHLQNGVDVIWRNHGKGVAIDAEFYLRRGRRIGGMVFPSSYHILTTIGIEGHKEVSFKEEWVGICQNQPEVFHPQLEAKYYDIYGRKITTVQELDIVKGDKKAFLGTLYFTINGKRLREEVNQND